MLDDPAEAAAIGEAGRAAALELSWERNAEADARACTRTSCRGARKDAHAPRHVPRKPPSRHPAAASSRSPTPTASTSSATSAPTACRSWPWTRTRAPSACARATPPAWSAPIRSADEEAFVSLPRGRRPAPAAQGRPVPDPRRVHLAASRGTPRGSSPGSSSRSPAGRRCSACTTSAPRWRRPGASGVDTPQTVFVDSAADLERGADRDRLPGDLQARRLAGLQDALPPSRARDPDARRTRARLRARRRLRHADAAGGHPRRRRGALDVRLVPRCAVAAARRSSPATSCASTRPLRPLSHGGQPLGRRGGGGRLRLLQELRYHGVSQVEFKRDPRDGRNCLMEVNARHWMWHSLAAASGVNLSLAAYRDAIGHPYVARRQVDGRKWVVAITDIRDAQAEFRHGEREVLPWLKSYAGVVQDGVLSVRDPVPGRCWPPAAPSAAWRGAARAQIRNRYERRSLPRSCGGDAPGRRLPGELRQRPRRHSRPRP